VTLEECIERGYTIPEARALVNEQARVWNLLQPLEGNRGWDALVEMLAKEAAQTFAEIDGLDLTQQYADRVLVRLTERYQQQIKQANRLRDARKANQEAARILTHIGIREKEQGNA